MIHNNFCILIIKRTPHFYYSGFFIFYNVSLTIEAFINYFFWVNKNHHNQELQKKFEQFIVLNLRFFGTPIKV